MKTPRQTVHLICNAHLDPVWLWQWPEGAAEALATFRVAADLCEEHDTFIFNHNEVILYEWIQEYEPALFKRIQKLVKQGRWHIMGGWYLQPDCNMPAGESFVRQILTGRAYFKKHFNSVPRTAINLDPFGHTRGLVQILAKAGFDSYLFGRPDENFLTLASNAFVWVGYDGSEVLATRFPFPYNSELGRARENIEQRIEKHADVEVLPILWGVGNHGGGPSRHDIKQLRKLIEQQSDRTIKHSTPEAYFADLGRHADRLPKYRQDLNPWGPGCYTSMALVKQKHRQLENDLYLTEKMLSTAAVQERLAYPLQDVQQAQRDLLVAQFHDILPGSAIAPVEQDSLHTLGHGLEILSRLRTRAFLALAQGQKAAPAGTIPVLVYNPHPFAVDQIVECEFNLPMARPLDTWTDVHVHQGKTPLPAQVEKEHTSLPCDWRKRVVFRARLEPGQMNRFDCTTTVLPAKPEPALKKNKAGHYRFKTDDLEVVINGRSGLIDRYRVDGRDCLAPQAFRPVVMRDDADSWTTGGTRFNKQVGAFKLAPHRLTGHFTGADLPALEPLHVIEDGPARTVVEALFHYGSSFICQRYKLPKVGTEIELEITVQWNEKDRMLKLRVPSPGAEDETYIGQVAYGVADLPADGTEAVAQKWTGLVSRKNNLALTVINDGIYGSDFSDKGWRLTLLRSPAYAAEDLPQEARQRYVPRQDQGRRTFRLWFNAGKVNTRLNAVDREALVRNEKPEALSFFPSGQGRPAKPFATLSDGVIQIAAIKPAEKGPDYVIRLFEPTGRRRTTTLNLPLLKKRLKLTFGAFELKTLRINPTTGKHCETDLLEKPMAD